MAMLTLVLGIVALGAVFGWQCGRVEPGNWYSTDSRPLGAIVGAIVGQTIAMVVLIVAHFL